MTRTILSLIALTFAFGLLAGNDQDRIWVDDRLEECRRGKATHYFVIVDEGKTFSLEMYTKDEVLRMKGQSMDERGQVFHGDFEFYHPNGELESVGSYASGHKVGLWQRYDIKGNRLAERTYAAFDAQHNAYTFVDEMPVYEAGTKNFVEIVKQKLAPIVNSNELADNGPHIEVGFIVAEDGQLRGIELTQGLHASWNVEANELIKPLPSWIPGKKSGENVRVYVRLPIDLSR